MVKKKKVRNFVIIVECNITLNNEFKSSRNDCLIMAFEPSRTRLCRVVHFHEPEYHTLIIQGCRLTLLHRPAGPVTQ